MCQVWRPENGVILWQPVVHRGAHKTRPLTGEIAAGLRFTGRPACRVVVQMGEGAEAVAEEAGKGDELGATHVVHQVKLLALHLHPDFSHFEHLMAVKVPGDCFAGRVHDDLHVMHGLGLTRAHRDEVGEAVDPSNSHVPLIHSINNVVGEVEGKVHPGLRLKDPESTRGQADILQGIDVIRGEGELPASFSLSRDTSLKLKGEDSPFWHWDGSVGVDEIFVVIGPIRERLISCDGVN